MAALSVKSSSINLSRFNTQANRRKDTLGMSAASNEKRSTIASNPGGGGAVPQGAAHSIIYQEKNASNNVNGDEFYKVHGAEGKFCCSLPNCAACK